MDAGVQRRSYDGSSKCDVTSTAGLIGDAELGASVPAAADHGGHFGGPDAALSSVEPGATDAAAGPLAHVCFGSQGATFAPNGQLQIHGPVFGASMPLSAVLQLAKEHLAARSRSNKTTNK